MREVLLYMCEACEGVKAFSIDFGNATFTMCQQCNIIREFNRIYVGRGPNLYKESHFYIDIGNRRVDDTKDNVKEE